MLRIGEVLRDLAITTHLHPQASLYIPPIMSGHTAGIPSFPLEYILTMVSTSADHILDTTHFHAAGSTITTSTEWEHILHGDHMKPYSPPGPPTIAHSFLATPSPSGRMQEISEKTALLRQKSHLGLARPRPRPRPRLGTTITRTRRPCRRTTQARSTGVIGKLTAA